MTRRARAPSVSRAEAVEHGRDAVEQLLARLDRERFDVAPSDRRTQPGSCLAVGASSGGEARDAMTALAAVAFGDVEDNRAERRA